MKRFGLSLTFASAMLFHGAFFLPAQEPPPAMMTPMAGIMTNPSGTEGMRGADLLKRFDKNGDGRIDDDERTDAKEAMMQEQLDRQMERITASQATPEQLRQRALEFFDQDRDGRLSDDERAILQKFLETRAVAGSAPARAAWREEFIKRVDRNANGRLDPDEHEDLRRFLLEPSSAATSANANESFEELDRLLRAAIEGNSEQRRRFDLNGDGRLDDTEWTAARRQIGRVFVENEEVSRMETRRLEAVAAEVARRREARENGTRKLEGTK